LQKRNTFILILIFCKIAANEVYYSTVVGATTNDKINTIKINSLWVSIRRKKGLF